MFIQALSFKMHIKFSVTYKSMQGIPDDYWFHKYCDCLTSEFLLNYRGLRDIKETCDEERHQTHISVKNIQTDKSYEGQ